MIDETLILGGGYVGNRLASYLDAPMTHRSTEKSIAEKSIYFNLQDPASWNNIPPASNVIWTFPAAPLELVKDFYQSKLANMDRLFVYASTSCYLVMKRDERVNENHRLDFGRERVKGEEWLRRQGATVLVLAGIYGPQRQPRDWLSKGLIKTPNKWLNLIHVDDIVSITARLMTSERNFRGERFNLADGMPLRWRGMAQHYDIVIEDSAETPDSKCISNTKICSWIGEYEFRSLF